MAIDAYTNSNTNNPQLDTLNKYNTYFTNRYYDPFVKGYAFVFMTKPFLFIYPSASTDPYKTLAYDNVCRDSYFSQYITGQTMNDQDRIIFEQLSFAKDFSGSDFFIGNNFLPIITNLTNNFEAQDVNLETIDSFETKQGYRMTLPTFTTASEAAGQFSIEFNESTNLDITKITGLWVNYINYISDGTFSANPEYVKARIIDYMSSLYYFVLDQDGKTIKYWSRYTGCYPTNIPYGNLSYSRGQTELHTVNINFNYTLKEDMKLEILEDFNKVSMNIQDEILMEEANSTYLSSKNSYYLRKENVYKKYREVYNGSGINPVIIAKDNSKEASAIPGTLGNKFQLLFPIDVEKLYTSYLFGNTNYVYGYKDNVFAKDLNE